VFAIYVFTRPERRVLWIVGLAVECSLLAYLMRVRARARA